VDPVEAVRLASDFAAEDHLKTGSRVPGPNVIFLECLGLWRDLHSAKLLRCIDCELVKMMLLARVGYKKNSVVTECLRNCASCIDNDSDFFTPLQKT
jgi:hypothetical protein